MFRKLIKLVNNKITNAVGLISGAGVTAYGLTVNGDAITAPTLGLLLFALFARNIEKKKLESEIENVKHKENENS